MASKPGGKSRAKSSARASKAAHGGKRAGSGRKPTAVNLTRAELLGLELGQLGPELPRLLADLIRLAHGGYERVSERWEPAGLVLIDAPALNPDGTVQTDANGRPIKRKVSAFPDLAADALVLVSRAREIADGDREAAKYLVDRLIGKPVQPPAAPPADRAGVDEDLIRQAAGIRAARAAAAEGPGDAG